MSFTSGGASIISWGCLWSGRDHDSGLKAVYAKTLVTALAPIVFMLGAILICGVLYITQHGTRKRLHHVTLDPRYTHGGRL